jgi:hypothetical protein
MNKWIIGGTLLATSLMAHAETFPVHIAKPMAVGTTSVPVGDYTLAPTKGNPSIMLLEGKTVKVFVFGRVVQSTYTKPTVELDNLKPTNFDEPVKLAASNK